MIDIELPDAVRSAIDGYDVAPASRTQSGATVLRLEAARRPALYLKYGTDAVADAIVAEMSRLVWLKGYAPAVTVPSIVNFLRLGEVACLVTTALDGQNAYEYLATTPDRRAAAVCELAQFLRALHALPLAGCPFHAGHALRLADAQRNIEAGRVKAGDFDAARAGQSPNEVWTGMLALLPLPFERVVTHGDCSLDNFIIDAEGRVTGCVDVGGAGAADPYQDLALLHRDLEAFGDDLPALLLQAYGIETPDQRRLRFHVCLDEFF